MRQNLTAGRVRSFACPPGKAQAFAWDAQVPALALRATAGGAQAFIFQSRLGDGRSLRMTIGSPQTWTIGAARAEARRLQALIDRGIDPRVARAEVQVEQRAQLETMRAERAAQSVSGAAAWQAYLSDRRPHWGERHYADHVAMARPASGRRKAGPLAALLAGPLAAIDEKAIEDWLARETAQRPTQTALAFRLVRAFLNWCAEQDDYRAIVRADAHRPRRIREMVPRAAARDDCLQREQLAAWFAEVRKLAPPVAAYLQALMLTGARRGELLGLRWGDVDFRWSALTIRDKVEGTRTIPLTPHLTGLLRDLQARNSVPPPVPRRLRRDPDAAEAMLRDWRPSEWVFTSPRSASGRLAEPRMPHDRALAAAGLPPLTLHGLRRSFGTLAEWVECPTGVIAQIMGHKPSAIAEKHYRARPLDLLRLWHERIEAWILAEAGVTMPEAGPRAVEREA